jgi:hypothetical protein
MMSKTAAGTVEPYVFPNSILERSRCTDLLNSSSLLAERCGAMVTTPPSFYEGIRFDLRASYYHD